MRFGVFSYWDDSYWGGAPAAIGGALVLGALPRILKRYRLRDAILMGIGLVMLANSRPYEGFVLSLPVAAALLFWMKGKAARPFLSWLAASFFRSGSSWWSQGSQWATISGASLEIHFACRTRWIGAHTGLRDTLSGNHPSPFQFIVMPPCATSMSS